MAKQEKQDIIATPALMAPEKTHYSQVADFLDRNHFDFSRTEERDLLSMTLVGACTNYRVFVQVTEIETFSQIVVYAVYPIRIPERRRAAVAESILRINFGVVQGMVEMDWIDGEIRVKTIGSCDGMTVSDALLNYLIATNVGCANSFLEPLLAVGFGNAPPETVTDMMMALSKPVLQ